MRFISVTLNLLFDVSSILYSMVFFNVSNVLTASSIYTVPSLYIFFLPSFF